MVFDRLVREPLVHFTLLGLALFAADRALDGRAPRASSDAEHESAETAAPRSPIVVTAEVQQSLREEHARAHGREPTAQEKEELVARFIDEEVLAREGKALGLDEDDPRIRERLAQKMAFVLEQGMEPIEPTDAELRAFFDANPGKWKTSELVDFTQVFVQGSDTGAHTRAVALLAELQGGRDPARLGDTFSGGRRYRRRRVADLEASFGGDFTQGLNEQEEGTWALRRSRFGFHLVRVDRRTPEQNPDLDAVRSDVAYEYKTKARAERLAAKVAELRARWVIERR